jgi:hypothetical protein
MKKINRQFLLRITIKAILVIIFVAKPRTINPVRLPGAEVNNYKGERLNLIADTPALGLKECKKLISRITKYP